MSIRFSDEEFENLKNLLLTYEWGLKTLKNRINIVDEELKTFQKRDAIDYIASRIKTPQSIAGKLHNLDKPLTAQSASENLFDIAGMRIICPFIDDIHFLVSILHTMPDINIISEKDYVSRPKPSGYRSYHLILDVPVFFDSKMEHIAVEVQIRTEAMNFWSTLEHKVRYKYHGDIPKHLGDELAIIAEEIDKLDNRMFLIHEIVSLINA